MEQIQTDEVSPSIAPLSQAIADENYIFVSGQVARNTEGEFVTGSIEDEARQVLENAARVLEEAGSSLDDVVKVQVFITDRSDWEQFNAVYREHMSEPYPARSAIIVDLALEEINVEVEMIAKRRS
jgi:2-iminobutanoate/2-iminopropanoate deaminase